MNSRKLSGPHFKIIFQKGNMIRLYVCDDSGCEACLSSFLSDEGMEEALIIIFHMRGVTGLREEDHKDDSGKSYGKIEISN